MDICFVNRAKEQSSRAAMLFVASPFDKMKRKFIPTTAKATTTTKSMNNGIV